MTTTKHSASRSLGRAVAYGAVAGVIASLVMAMYAMAAAWVQGTGFFTPLYHIASVLAPPTAMEASMENAMGGSAFTFTFGTAVLGAVVHMMTGAGYGAVFGLLVARLRMPALATAGLGLVYGAVVLVVSAYVALPIAAAVLGGGAPISDMAQMAGWATFTIEHLVFGVVLGLLVGLRFRSRAESTASSY